MSRSALILAAIASLALLWMHRFDLQSSDGKAYRMDRITGQVVVYENGDGYILEIEK